MVPIGATDFSLDYKWLFCFGDCDCVGWSGFGRGTFDLDGVVCVAGKSLLGQESRPTNEDGCWQGR